LTGRDRTLKLLRSSSKQPTHHVASSALLQLWKFPFNFSDDRYSLRGVAGLTVLAIGLVYEKLVLSVAARRSSGLLTLISYLVLSN
jgi:hypothetical protein